MLLAAVALGVVLLALIPSVLGGDEARPGAAASGPAAPPGPAVEARVLLDRGTAIGMQAGDGARLAPLSGGAP
jgi:hypothetical protein